MSKNKISAIAPLAAWPQIKNWMDLMTPGWKFYNGDNGVEIGVWSWFLDPKTLKEGTITPEDLEGPIQYVIEFLDRKDLMTFKLAWYSLTEKERPRW